MPHFDSQLGNVLDLSTSTITVALLGLSQADQPSSPQFPALPFAFLINRRGGAGTWPE